MVPDRLSYSEMYESIFLYPSEWTENWKSYNEHKQAVCNLIVQHMKNYDMVLPLIRRQARTLTEKFFSADKLLQNIN